MVGLTKGSDVDYPYKEIRINVIPSRSIKSDILQNTINSGAYDENAIVSIHHMKKLGDPTGIAIGIYFLAVILLAI